MLKLNQLKLKEKGCLRNDGYQVDLPNVTSLYVVTNRTCNAHCKFCTFCGQCEDVDIAKLKYALDRIYRYFELSAVHITGGEPTLLLDKVEQICTAAKAKDSFIKTSVNTNGKHLADLAGISVLDNVALSRHGISDTENFEIFGTTDVAAMRDIVDFPKSKLHLSCNLIKGHIDSEDKIYQYLEMCSELGVYDVGIVGLMPVNQYCREHYAEYPELHKCITTRSYRNIVNDVAVCECRNWLYRAHNCNMISVYHRHALRNTEVVSYLVYENNKLRIGFNGEFIDLD